MKKARGFTLIEVLVAISVMVVVASIAYTFFDSAVDASESNQEILADVNQLETVFQLLATDVHHIIDRRLPQASAGVGSREGSVPAFMGGNPELSDTHFLQGEYSLRFVRDGWANPLQLPRSDLQRVGYLWLDGQLWRDYWAERNQPYDTQPTGRRLLAENIEGIRIRFLPDNAENLEDRSWSDTWPPSRSLAGQQRRSSSLPAALEIILTLEELGDVRRVFALPGI